MARHKSDPNPSHKSRDGHQSLAQRIDDNPVAVIAKYIVIFSGVLALAWRVSVCIIHYVQRPRWPTSEYRILARLRLGVDENQMVSSLGSPARLLRPASKAGGVVEADFIRPGYWIQVFFNANRTVQQYTVIACLPSFQPTMSNHAAPGDRPLHAQLNVSRPSDITPVPDNSKLNVPADNAPTYEEDVNYGLAGNDVVTQWGVDLSCQNTGITIPIVNSSSSGWDCYNDLLQCSFGKAPSQGFRSAFKINAWSECDRRCADFPGSVNTRLLPFDRRAY